MEIWPNEVCDTSFGIHGLDDSFLFVFKVKEVVFFLEAVSERHLPFAEDVITLFFFAE